MSWVEYELHSCRWHSDRPSVHLLPCQIRDSATNNTKGITRRKGWRTSQLKEGQENTGLLLKTSKGLGDGSSRDGVVAVDLCLPAQLAHRQAWRSVFAKCSHLWWTSCCPGPFHPTWLSPPASPEQHLQLWQWQKQAAGPSRFVLVDCSVVVLIGFESASGGILKTDRAGLTSVTPPLAKKQKQKESFLFNLKQESLIIPPSSRRVNHCLGDNLYLQPTSRATLARSAWTPVKTGYGLFSMTAFCQDFPLMVLLSRPLFFHASQVGKRITHHYPKRSD